ncbi:MAG: helix-turn-helix transcriptional regulator [Campylobacterota bacterium]|nr:helix-turn-helix transcriptional regulator [Campylobacterota bacterium]
MEYCKSYCEPVYLISEVSKILKLHPQTLRQYEREGLVKPSRTNGKIRLYSQENIDNIKTILNLTRDEGINLSGVSMILELKREIETLKLHIKNLEVSKEENLSNNKALVVKNEQYDMIIFED